MIQVEFHAMGCAMAAFLDTGSPQAARALQQVPAWFEEWEQALSRFRPDSELNRLNASAGQPVMASETLWEVLEVALQAAAWTGGLVNPEVLTSLERAGYDRSFDLLQNPRGAGSPAAAFLAGIPGGQFALSGWQRIRLDSPARAITLPEGVRLDFGGIAKGWAARQAMQRLSLFGPALVDAGGDLAASGPRADGSPWLVAVDDPLGVQESLAMLALPGCGVATSGIDYHRWLQNGSWKHHIIDPRSGEPAETDLMSVTIIAEQAERAEAAAKAVLIQGSETGLDWLEEQDGLAGLLALQDGRVIHSSLMHEYLEG